LTRLRWEYNRRRFRRENIYKSRGKIFENCVKTPRISRLEDDGVVPRYFYRKYVRLVLERVRRSFSRLYEWNAIRLISVEPSDNINDVPRETAIKLWKNAERSGKVTFGFRVVSRVPRIKNSFGGRSETNRRRDERPSDYYAKIGF